ncbi:copper homeostasis protein CutC [Demequina activiva]|uniref:PF03932 family protein CutC n=1 Tax=Demequina activiva TaxID=1582364 RepID=A0A919Q492_9MICO|nr:copper homeostasis protein CutC [Demequina activiva]GIG55546.1 copper homeostasis protein CutC [Demequina activiva]
MPPHTASSVLVEIVIDDVEGAVVAEREGADRVELCADLGQGGTTPSIGMIRQVLARVARVGVQVMVRPRGGDFVYDEDEVAVMVEDARAIRDLAASARVRVGIVTGALTAEGAVDEQTVARIVQAAQPVPVTFHKAIDDAADLDAAYAGLARLGVERVLTSGGAPTAAQGADALARLAAAPFGPAVLAGGGVRPHNVGALLASAPVREVHLRAQSPSLRGDGTLRTDPETVRAAVEAARS